MPNKAIKSDCAFVRTDCRCGILRGANNNLLKCKPIQCKFFKTEERLKTEREATNERIRNLPKSKREYIINKYHIKEG